MTEPVYMQKFVNDPSSMVDESIEGFVKCYPDIVAYTENKRVLKYAGGIRAGKVGIVTGGGYGHDPAFIGYIGKNMVDVGVAGDIFTPPTPDEFYTAFKNADAGAGILCLLGNYIRDIDSANEAIARAAKENITVRIVSANDDVAEDHPSKRRGSCGEIFMWKAGGAAAEMGYNLFEAEAAAQKAVDNSASISVGLSSAIIPVIGRPNYLIEAGTMEIGVGHHGLSSQLTCKLKTAEQTADIMIDKVTSALDLESGEEVVALVSGMGNTMLMELNILFNRIYDRLIDKGIIIFRSYIGNYFTSLDMMGATLSVMRLDEELKEMMDMPVYTAAFNHFHIK